MTAVQKLAEVEAEEKLNAKGIFRQFCPKCHGSGCESVVDACLTCGGAGTIWNHIHEAPPKITSADLEKFAQQSRS